MPIGFVAVTKAAFAQADWIALRRSWRALDVPNIKQRATAAGLAPHTIGTAPTGYSGRPEHIPSGLDQALAAALEAGRWETAVLLHPPLLHSTLAQTLPNLERTIGPARLSAALRVGRDGSTGLLTLIDFASAASETCDPRVVRRWFEERLKDFGDTIDAMAAAALRAVFGLAPSAWTVRHASTHIITLSTGPRMDLPLIRETHRDEEQTDTDESAELLLQDFGVTYAHCGWSHSSFHGATTGLVALVAPQVVHVDLTFGALWEQTRVILDQTDLSDQIPLNAAITRLKDLQTLGFELKVWRAEEERYARGLKPWQSLIYNRLWDYWGMGAMQTQLSELVESLISQARSRIDAASARNERTQSRILGMLGVLGLLGIFGTVNEYIAFHDRQIMVDFAPTFLARDYHELVLLAPYAVLVAAIALAIRLSR